VSFDPNAPAAGDGVYGLPHSPTEARVVVVPVPFEATTSYGGGTAGGPRAILVASRQVDLFDIETGRPYAAGIAMLPEHAEVRQWSEDGVQMARRWRDQHALGLGDAALEADRDRLDGLCERLNRGLRSQVEALLAAGKLVGCVGGDHGSVFGAIAAHAGSYPGLGILHVDAHADLRHAYEGFAWSHASIMDNVLAHLPGVARIVQVGVRDLCEEERDRIAHTERVRTHFDALLTGARAAGQAWAEEVARIVADLPEQVYVSFDVDGLDPALCPHTGTPVPGGLSFQEASYLLGAVARSGRRIVGFDLVEVAPGPEGNEWDANVGARLLYKLIGWMLVSQGEAPPA